MDRPAPPNSGALRRGRVSERNRIYLVTFRCAGRRPLLATPNLGQIVANEILRIDSSSLTNTFAFVVMPDHVHWLFELCSTETLSNVVRSLKGRSSRRINRLRESPENVWQTGFHDRALRYADSLREAGFYVVNNPVRAGLVDQWWHYPFVYINPGIAAEAAPTAVTTLVPDSWNRG